eukprot:gene17934-24330_t
MRQVTSMSFLGVGAPEAVLVAVVALVVFGPKGLADAAKSAGKSLKALQPTLIEVVEAAKSAGKSLKALQPTLKEVVEVSRELKGTIESELGLDEFNSIARDTYRNPTTNAGSRVQDPHIEHPRPPRVQDPGIEYPRPPPPPAGTPTSNAGSRVQDPDIEAKRAESAKMAWEGASGAESSGAESAPALPAQASASMDLSVLSMEELEAEMAKRKAAIDKPKV